MAELCNRGWKSKAQAFHNRSTIEGAELPQIHLVEEFTRKTEYPEARVSKQVQRSQGQRVPGQALTQSRKDRTRRPRQIFHC